jgi:hypothetical protein
MGTMLALACGGDDEGATQGTASDATDSASASDGSTSGSASDSASTASGMTEGSTGPTSDSNTTTGVDTESTSMGTDTAATDTGSTGDFACPELPRGPLTPELVSEDFAGTEDIAFDAAGGMVGRDGDDLVRLESNGTTSAWGSMSGFAYDMRFDLDGNLIVARPQLGSVVRITPGGDVSDVVTELSLPNGIHVDSMGRIWISAPNHAEILRVEADGSVTEDVLTGAAAGSAGGLVLDETRGMLFFTSYNFGQVRRAPVDDEGVAGAVEVVASPVGNPHGLALDACGNVYAVDHLNSRLYRLILDEAGDLVGEPELLASFETFVYNARFGVGPGFSETTLYVAGSSGSVWAVDVGVGPPS